MNINNDSNSSKGKPKTVSILGDSMVKRLNDYFFTKKMRHIYLVKARPFSGANVSCMINLTRWEARSYYTTYSDKWSSKWSTQIAKSIIELAMFLKFDGNSKIVSGIVPRFDNLNNQVTEVNNHLALMCGQRDIPFISHSETIDSSKHFNESKFYLN